MSAWTIREARGEDSAAAAAVVRAVFDEYDFTWEDFPYCADLLDLQTHYLDCGGRFWVCEANSTILGTAGLDVFPRVPGEIGETTSHEGKLRVAGSDCSLERLYVHPDARRQGVGAGLFEAVLAGARSIGCTSMEIWSDKHFAEAHRLYGRYGAKVIGQRICDDPDASEEWGMLLELRPRSDKVTQTGSP